MGDKQGREYLAKRAAFPYKPAAIDPGNASLHSPDPLVSAAGVMNTE
jgi:hypothetical protein